MIFPNHIAFKSPNLVGQMSSQILNLAIVVLSDYQCNEEMHTIMCTLFKNENIVLLG